MKTTFNLTTSEFDLERFKTRDEFLALLSGFDGVELMYCGEDERGIVPYDKIIGFHSTLHPCWLDFWQGNTKRLVKEFGSLDRAYQYYNGNSPEILVELVRSQFALAKRFGAEYMVYHLVDCGIDECMSGVFFHSDEEVIRASAEIVNAALCGEPSDGPYILFENLWEPGLTFTDPAMTKLLLDSVDYPKKGLMLDTGHIMHTDFSLKNQEEGLSYINKCLDEHGDLCKYIKGIHLNQSVTGEYVKEFRKTLKPTDVNLSYEERCEKLFYYIFGVDLHRPFTANGVKELIARVAPDYLNFEFISESLDEFKEMLEVQRNALL